MIKWSSFLLTRSAMDGCHRASNDIKVRPQSEPYNVLGATAPAATAACDGHRDLNVETLETSVPLEDQSKYNSNGSDNGNPQVGQGYW